MDKNIYEVTTILFIPVMGSRWIIFELYEGETAGRS